MKRNILHLTPNLEITCGISRSILTIATSTSEFNHFVVSYGGSAEKNYQTENIKFQKIKKLPSFLRIIHDFVIIFIYCKKNNIIILHSHHRYFDLLGWLIAKIINVKTVTSVRSKVKGKKNFSYKSDYLIAVSKSIKLHLINYFCKIEDKIRVIYNAVDENKYNIGFDREALLNKYSISSNQFILGYIGRFDIEEKGIDVLIKSLETLPSKFDNLLLLLIGDGKDLITINNLIKKTQIKYLFVSPQECIADYYNLIDIIILPSRIDPFPLVLLESGIMKKPVIASSVDGIKELIINNENGLLFKSDEINELANCIMKMVDDVDLRRKLADQLYKDVKTKYNLQIMAESYTELYQKVFSES